MTLVSADCRWLCAARPVRPSDLWPEPGLPLEALPDRGARDGKRFLLSPRGGIRRFCPAGADLVRQPLRSRLRDPGADRHLRRSGELSHRAAARTGDQGKDPRTGSRRRLNTMNMRRAGSLLTILVSLAMGVPVYAQSRLHRLRIRQAPSTGLMLAFLRRTTAAATPSPADEPELRAMREQDRARPFVPRRN